MFIPPMKTSLVVHLFSAACPVDVAVSSSTTWRSKRDIAFESEICRKNYQNIIAIHMLVIVLLHMLVLLLNYIACSYNLIQLIKSSIG